MESNDTEGHDTIDENDFEAENQKDGQESVEAIFIGNKEDDNYNETKDINTDSNDIKSITEKHESLLDDGKNQLNIEIILDEEDQETDGQETDTVTTAKIQVYIYIYIYIYIHMYIYVCIYIYI
jgi:hypothetical protein